MFLTSTWTLESHNTNHFLSRSAYYAWVKKGEAPSEATVDEAYLANAVFDLWTASRRRYGAPRVTAALCKQGEQVPEKRVARLMAEIGIARICGRKKVRTTRRDPDARPAAALVERDFSADAPTGLWVSDVTYIPTDEGWHPDGRRLALPVFDPRRVESSTG